jgi:HlyD family secretion protein
MRLSGWLLLTVFLAGCGGAKKEAADAGAPTPVQVETVRKGPIDHIVTADAVLYPVNLANVTAKISSPVKRVLVNRGDHVKAGQLLIELESADLAATANESKSLYEQALAALQMMTGSTVVDDKSKAQNDLRSAQQSRRRRCTKAAWRCTIRARWQNGW